MANDLTIRTHVPVRTMSAGTRLVVFRRIEEIAQDAASPRVPKLKRLLDRSIPHELELLALIRNGEPDGSRAKHAPEARATWSRLSTLLVVFHSRLQSTVLLTPPPEADGVAAQLLLDEKMPQGVGALSKQDFVNCHASVSGLLDLSAEDTAAIEALGHTALVDEIRTVNEAFGAALHPVVEPISDMTVAQGDKKGAANLAAVVARIVGHFADEDDPADRAALELYLSHYATIVEEDRAQKRRGPRADEPMDCDPDDPGVDGVEDEIDDDGIEADEDESAA